MGTFATADGHVNIAAIDGRIWLELTRVLDLPELLEDPRFATVDLRMDHRDDVNALVAAKLRTRTTAEWIADLEAAGVPAGPVNDVGEVFADAQVQHLEMVQPVEHPEMGELRLIGNAATLAGLPRSCAPRRRQRASTTRRSWPSSACPPPTSSAFAARGPSDARAPAGPRRRRRDLADVRPRRAAQRAVDGDVPLAARRARAHRAPTRSARRRPPRRRRRRVHVGRGHLRAGRPGGAEDHHGRGTRRWRR